MPTFVSLFAGMGGMDAGFEAAGFDPLAAIELDSTACATLRKNFKCPIVKEDIHNVSAETLKRLSDVGRSDVDVLIGGPPCQPFSKAGYWSSGDTKRLNDPRSGTLGQYIRLLGELQPKVFVLENVFGIKFKDKDEGFRFLLDSIEEINREFDTKYRCSWKILNAADYGVPQIRERFFLVGSRAGDEFQFPEPTHCCNDKLNQNSLFNDDRDPWLTAWDAIGDLNRKKHTDLNVGGKWGNLLASIPEGMNYLHHTERGEGLSLFGWRRRYWSFLLKLSKRLPSWTIQAQPGSAIGPFHWKNRRLSVREMCRIQTIPDQMLVEGGRTEAQRQIGNAVPSLLAEVLARAIAEQFLGVEFDSLTPTLMLNRKSRIPTKEQVSPVPDEYLPLVGDYAAHPGTGKGHLVKGM